jgi:hypothetical protein
LLLLPRWLHRPGLEAQLQAKTRLPPAVHRPVLELDPSVVLQP